MRTPVCLFHILHVIHPRQAREHPLPYPRQARAHPLPYPRRARAHPLPYPRRAKTHPLPYPTSQSASTSIPTTSQWRATALSAGNGWPHLMMWVPPIWRADGTLFAIAHACCAGSSDKTRMTTAPNGPFGGACGGRRLFAAWREKCQCDPIYEPVLPPCGSRAKDSKPGAFPRPPQALRSAGPTAGTPWSRLIFQASPQRPVPTPPHRNQVG